MANSMGTSIRAGLFMALCATTSMTAISAANAQDAGERGATLLQRLIVGAGKEKVAVDTPQAVTLIEQEDIDQEIAETAADFIEKIPGVNATGNADNVLGQNFNIRGFGPQEVGSNQEGRVLVNVDGATKYYESYRMGGFFGDPELYKSVEVLRGPSSGTLYGTGVLGGVITFVTKDASDFLEDGDQGALKIKMTGDSNQEGYKASAILAMRMGENAEFLGNINYTDFQNIVDGNGDELFGTANKFPGGLAKGTFYLDEARERILRIKYEQTQIDGLSTATPGGVGHAPILVNRTASDTSALISYEDDASDNPWLDLNVNLSYSNLSNEQDELVKAKMDYTYYELKVDNTFEWINDNYENYLTVGLSGKYHERRRFDTDGSSGASHPEGNERNVGVFAQNEFVYDDRLTLIGGLRVEWRELEPTGTTLFESDTSTPRPVSPRTVSDTAIAPKIAAIYKLTDNLSVFGSYAYTERMPGIDEEFDWNAATTQNNLSKEKANSFEAGVSGSIDNVLLDNDNFSYKITGYYNIVDDVVVRGRGRSFPSDPQYLNQGEARVYGAEFEAAYDSTYFFASTYASLIRGDNLFTDDPLTSIAPDELGFTLGGKLPDWNMRFGWDARFVAAQKRLPPPASGIPEARDSFNTHDLWVSWRPDEGMLKGFEATARIDNITDEFYQEYLGTAGPSKGRNFKAALAYTVKF